MWIVAKYNSKELEVFKKELSDKLDKDVNQRDESIETQKKFVIQNVSSQKTPKQNQGT